MLDRNWLCLCCSAQIYQRYSGYTAGVSTHLIARSDTFDVFSSGSFSFKMTIWTESSAEHSLARLLEAWSALQISGNQCSRSDALQDEVLIVGGGVAGCAVSIALARKGRSVRLIEREIAPRHKVCGEFLSGEALEDLHALGIDVASLGAVPIDYVRLATTGRAAQAPLPFQAASLTRKALDTALIAEAIAAGVHVECGRAVQLSRPNHRQALAGFARRRHSL